MSLPGHGLLDGLQRAGQDTALRFADQQMHVLRHDHVAGNVEIVEDTTEFQRDFKLMHGARAGQQWLAAIATEGYEVQIVSFLMALQSARHVMRIVGLRTSSMTVDT